MSSECKDCWHQVHNRPVVYISDYKTCFSVQTAGGSRDPATTAAHTCLIHYQNKSIRSRKSSHAVIFQTLLYRETFTRWTWSITNVYLHQSRGVRGVTSELLCDVVTILWPCPIATVSSTNVTFSAAICARLLQISRRAGKQDSTGSCCKTSSSCA